MNDRSISGDFLGMEACGGVKGEGKVDEYDQSTKIY
jgi:hypothetical protein